MTVAILILLIFNTGLLMVLSGGVLWAARKDMTDVSASMIKHIDESIEAGVTALFNKESLKQKAEMTGKAEL